MESTDLDSQDGTATEQERWPPNGGGCHGWPWARGDEQMGDTWNNLDITALGRQETWEGSPGYPQTPPYEWWIWHDEARI